MNQFSQLKIRSTAIAFLVLVVSLLFVPPLFTCQNCFAQETDFKVGTPVSLYEGGSAKIVTARILAVTNNSYSVRYTSYSGTSVTASLPKDRFWKAGDEPNPPPKNEFELGDNIKFYYRRTDQVVEGKIYAISTAGRYTVGPRIRGVRRGGLSESMLPEAIWKEGAAKKPLPKNYRASGARAGVSSKTNKGSTAKPKPLRTWKALSGKTSITARYLSHIEGTVKIQKEDGTNIDVELGQLSPEDNQYVENIDNGSLKRREITTKPTIPFSENRLKLTGGKWDYRQEDSTSNYDLPSGTIRMAHAIGFGASHGRRSRFWADGPEAWSSGHSQKTLEYDFTQWTMAQDGKRVYLLANSRFDQGCVVQGFNFATGELEFDEVIDGHGVGVSLDGTKVAVVQNGFNKRGELIIKEIGVEGAVLERHTVKSFSDDSGFNPSGGYFMNDSILTTIGDRFVAFDVNRGTGYSTTPFPKFARLTSSALSPNRKVIALASSGGIFLFDVSRGKPVGAIKMEDGLGLGDVAFSSDGSRLIHVGKFRGGIRIYNLATGDLSKEIASQDVTVFDSIAWVHPRFLLIDGKSLLDLELGIVIWRFKTKGSFFEPLFYMGGNTFLSNDGNQNLTTIKLPLDRIAKAASGFSIDEATALKQGDDFRLDIDTNFGMRDNQLIRDHFAKSMQGRGITYNENSQNVFTCTVDTHSEKSDEIRVSDDETVTVQYTPTTCTIELEIEGELKWQVIRKNTFTGGTLVGQRGENPQQAVTRLCKARVSTFSKVRFPYKFILFPGGKNALGSSEISKDGVKDVD